MHNQLLVNTEIEDEIFAHAGDGENATTAQASLEVAGDRPPQPAIADQHASDAGTGDAWQQRSPNNLNLRQLRHAQ